MNQMTDAVSACSLNNSNDELDLAVGDGTDVIGYEETGK